HANLASLSTDVVKNFNTAWGRTAEEHIFKRIIFSIAQLSIGSTVESVVILHCAVTKIQWFPSLGDDDFRLFEAMRLDQANFPRLSDQLEQPGTAALIVNLAYMQSDPNPLPGLWPLLINVGTELYPAIRDCDSTITILPSNTSIPSFFLDLTAADENDSHLYGCFASAVISFEAAFGLCSNCRVTTYSTVQNDTQLSRLTGDTSIQVAVDNMPRYISEMTPFENSLSNPGDGLEVYVTALLTCLYSALWDAWIYASGMGIVRTRGSHKPAVLTLRAEISETRVYVWFALQFLFTLAGLAFIRLQSGARYPLITDTGMVAFDIDSTEAPKSGLSSGDDLNGLLRIKPKGGRWKVVTAY
ncbi:hypothetical protein FRC11_014186, partial [Ceratobasidium sp. 423]